MQLFATESQGGVEKQRQRLKGRPIQEAIRRHKIQEAKAIIMDFKDQFISFLQDLADSSRRLAVDSGDKASGRRLIIYRRALNSLKAAEGPFPNAHSLMQVNGIGSTIADTMHKRFVSPVYSSYFASSSPMISETS